MKWQRRDILNRRRDSQNHCSYRKLYCLLQGRSLLISTSTLQFGLTAPTKTRNLKFLSTASVSNHLLFILCWGNLWITIVIHLYFNIFKKQWILCDYKTDPRIHTHFSGVWIFRKNLPIDRISSFCHFPSSHHICSKVLSFDVDADISKVFIYTILRKS